MLLFELMTNTADWKLVKNSNPNSGAVKYMFRLPDGRDISVQFGTPYNRNGINVWDLTFQEADNQTHTRFDKTDKGGELIIFATVMDIMHHFVSQHPNDVVEFSADLPNRISLYTKMLQRFIKRPLAYMPPSTTMHFVVGHEDVIAEMGDDDNDDNDWDM